MQVRVLALAVVAIAGVAGITAAVREQALAWRAAGGPERLAAAWRDPGGRPTAWLFLRPGCPHCRTHLQALGRALDAFPDSVRARVQSRLVFAGDVTGAPPGVRIVPDSLRGAWRVGIAPTTWWVDRSGTIRRAWRGARTAEAWRRELEFLAAGAVVP